MNKNVLLAGFECLCWSTFFLLLTTFCTPTFAAVPFYSAHALVIDEDSQEVLLEKDSATTVPIASITKLMTAVVVLDAQQSPEQLIRIDKQDIDRLKHTRRGVPVGAYFTRKALLELALMSSDNHAAMALARNYPGGLTEFKLAMQQKIEELDLKNTSLEEPTGLSSNNRSSAADLAKLLRAASTYPEIVAFTTQRNHVIESRGRKREYRNTNHLVGASGWNILLSKTGFTNEAGRCLAMRLQAAGRTFTVVLLGAFGKSHRTLDALNVHRWLATARPSVSPASNKQSFSLPAVLNEAPTEVPHFVSQQVSDESGSYESLRNLQLKLTMPRSVP